MSDAPGTTSQPTTSDNSPEAWAAAENPVEEVIAEEAAPEEESGTPPIDPNKVEAAAEEAEDADPPPEFWSKERKAEWAKITDPAIRAAIKDHYEEATRATSAKIEEAAKARKMAEEAIAAEHRNRDTLVQWFEQNAPRLQYQLAGKWGGYTPEAWKQLARDNPAEWTVKQAEYQEDMAAYREFETRRQAETQAAQGRAREAHQRERAAEHQKLAAKYPKEFGPDKAQDTYNTYSKFVLDHGISADRLEGIYEAGVVEIIQKAYKYDQLQAKAKEVTNPKPPTQNAARTPTRVAPGAVNRTANPEGETTRQAIHALRTKDRHNLQEVADAFR